MTEREVVEKCARLLKVPLGALGDDLNVVVIASNEALLPGQVVNVQGRRLAMVAELSREEFEIMRKFNARTRALRSLPKLVWEAEGTRPDTVKIIGQPDEPSRECCSFALFRDV